MTQPLRVLLLFWGTRGGGPRYTLEIARLLSVRKDIELHISLSHQSEFYQEFDEFSFKGRFDIDTYKGLFQFGFQSLKLLFLRRRLAQYIRKHKIEVVFCTMDHIWNAFVMGVIKKTDATYLLTVHDATRHPGEDQIWREWLLKKDINTSDATMVLTKSVGNSLCNYHNYPKSDIYISMHGLFSKGKLSKNHRKISLNTPIRLLFFGRILRYKGLDIILEAFPILQREFQRIELQIWGDGNIEPYKNKIKMIDNVRVENRWIEEEEIPKIFAENDLAVLPYNEASQSGVVPLAFSSGMPCVITPILGLSEQVHDGVTGVISSGFSPNEFAEAVAKVLRDHKFYEVLSKNCIDAANTKLNWKNIEKSVIAALYGVRASGKRIKAN